ncbi:MAG: tyrosine-type recombinase/integrase [Bacteroidales bacterium]|nr:tyrosine-type recombinase/integrase [Bacteroidales bacterium]
MTKITVESIVYKGEKRIKILFAYDTTLIKNVKQIPGRKWSETMRCWHIPDDKKSQKVLKQLFIQAKNHHNSLPDKQVNSKVVFYARERNSCIIKKYDMYLTRRNFSKKTQDSYTCAIRKLSNYYYDKELTTLTNDDINGYLYYISRNRYSVSMQNVTISAIKMLYSKILNQNLDIQKLERPRKTKPLPKVIAKEDIEKMLRSIRNQKHQMALLLIYSFGLRRSELINLKLSDINSTNKALTICNGKGFKDRILPISDKIMKAIISYYHAYTPIVYLIEGQKPGESYSPTSLQKIFHKYMDKIKPKNNYTLHCLRHSYATHLLENGTDLRYIQELLGHRSSRTTEIYTHVSVRSLRNIKTPSDDFEL